MRHFTIFCITCFALSVFGQTLPELERRRIELRRELEAVERSIQEISGGGEVNSPALEERAFSFSGFLNGLNQQVRQVQGVKDKTQKLVAAEKVRMGVEASVDEVPFQLTFEVSEATLTPRATGRLTVTPQNLPSFFDLPDDKRYFDVTFTDRVELSIPKDELLAIKPGDSVVIEGQLVAKAPDSEYASDASEKYSPHWRMMSVRFREIPDLRYSLTEFHLKDIRATLRSTKNTYRR